MFGRTQPSHCPWLTFPSSDGCCPARLCGHAACGTPSPDLPRPSFQTIPALAPYPTSKSDTDVNSGSVSRTFCSVPSDFSGPQQGLVCLFLSPPKVLHGARELGEASMRCGGDLSRFSILSFTVPTAAFKNGVL